MARRTGHLPPLVLLLCFAAWVLTRCLIYQQAMSGAAAGDADAPAAAEAPHGSLEGQVVEGGSREMRVRIAGEPGRRGDTNVWLVAADGSLQGHARWEDDVRVLRSPVGAGPDALVIAPGWRPERLAWQDGTVDVTLEQGLQVTLRATAPAAMAEGIRRGWCVLRPEHAVDGVHAQYFDVEFPASALLRGEAVRLRVPVPASYELRFAGDRNDGPGFLPLYRTVLQRGILLNEDQAEQRIVLPDPVRDDGASR